MIGHVVPGGTAVEKALEIAERVNACGPLAVEAVKTSVYDTAEMSEAEGLAADLRVARAVQLPVRSARPG